MELDRYAKEKQERCSLVLSKTHDYFGSGVEASLSIKEHTGERTAQHSLYPTQNTSEKVNRPLSRHEGKNGAR